MPLPKKSVLSRINNFGRATKCNPVAKCGKENPSKSAKINISCVNNNSNVPTSVKGGGGRNHGDGFVYKHQPAAAVAPAVPPDRGIPPVTPRSATTPLMDITASSNTGNKAAAGISRARPILKPTHRRRVVARGSLIAAGDKFHSVISTATTNAHTTATPAANTGTSSSSKKRPATHDNNTTDQLTPGTPTTPVIFRIL